MSACAMGVGILTPGDATLALLFVQDPTGTLLYSMGFSPG